MDKMHPLLPSVKWGKKRTGGAKLLLVPQADMYGLVMVQYVHMDYFYSCYND